MDTLDGGILATSARGPGRPLVEPSLPLAARRLAIAEIRDAYLREHVTRIMTYRTTEPLTAMQKLELADQVRSRMEYWWHDLVEPHLCRLEAA